MVAPDAEVERVELTPAAALFRSLGDPARLMIVQDHDARLVVLGSSSRTDLPRLLLGSVARRLLHMATRPVLIVPRTEAHAEPAESPAVAATASADERSSVPHPALIQGYRLPGERRRPGRANGAPALRRPSRGSCPRGRPGRVNRPRASGPRPRPSAAPNVAPRTSPAAVPWSPGAPS